MAVKNMGGSWKGGRFVAEKWRETASLSPNGGTKNPAVALTGGVWGGELVSGYAKKDRQEFFAEAYALLRKHGKDHNEYTRAIAGVVDVYKKIK